MFNKIQKIILIILKITYSIRKSCLLDKHFISDCFKNTFRKNIFIKNILNINTIKSAFDNDFKKYFQYF